MMQLPPRAEAEALSASKSFIHEMLPRELLLLLPRLPQAAVATNQKNGSVSGSTADFTRSRRDRYTEQFRSEAEQNGRGRRGRRRRSCSCNYSRKLQKRQKPRKWRKHLSVPSGTKQLLLKRRTWHAAETSLTDEASASARGESSVESSRRNLFRSKLVAER